MRKPNFLIVGAAKSGTTSLFKYLRQHPKIFMPDFKEPQFFVHKNVSGRLHKYISKRSDYYDLFSQSSELHVGEASVFYLYFFKDAIKNIKKELGDDVKIIIILREPVSRAISAYEHVSRNNIREDLDFKSALLNEEKRLKEDSKITPMVMYQDMSLYSDAVEAYQNAFVNVHITLYDDLVRNSKKCVDNIFKFLLLDEYDGIDYSKEYNSGGWNWKSKWIRDCFLLDGWFKKSIRIVIPNNIRKKMFKVLRSNSIKKQKSLIDMRLKSHLLESFKEDRLKLEKLINRNLDCWDEVA